MANPQTGYYPMTSPMSGYHGHQMYSQAPVPQPSYYNSLPQPHVNVPIQSSYVEQPRPQPMRPLSGNYDYTQQMQYSQPGYAPNSYSTSYQPAHSMLGGHSSYGSQPPMAGSPAGGVYGMPQRPSPPATHPGLGLQAGDRTRKPQCWEHGCNGREFSTFSNLLRHQREKSGTAQKSYCNHCGAEFTRTTARNGHMEHGKCKTRRGQGSSMQ